MVSIPRHRAGWRVVDFEEQVREQILLMLLIWYLFWFACNNSHSFISQICIEYLLWVTFYGRHWRYNSEQNRPYSYIHRDLILYVNKCREKQRYVGARFCKENSAVGRMKSNRGMGVSGVVLVKSSKEVKYTKTEGSQSWDSLKKNISGKRDSKCKGPESGTGLVYSRKKTKDQEGASKLGELRWDWQDAVCSDKDLWFNVKGFLSL